MPNTEGESLVPLHTTGEFLGDDFAAQSEKISKAKDVFAREEMPADVWVAPRHAFTDTTLAVLQDHGMTVISDGFGFRPVLDNRGFVWAPQ